MSAFSNDPETPPGKRIVMVVDDDQASRDVLRMFLEDEGYDVVALASPTAALAYAHDSADEIAVLLTDVHMPGMNGPELATRIRATRPALEVAFVSGDLEAPRGVPGVFIQKPIDLDEILALVARVIELAR